MLSLGRSLALLALLPTASAALGQTASLTIRIGKAEQPVITGLPFSADQSVRTVQQLANGITLTQKMKGRVYRSTNGLERLEGTLVATDPAATNPSDQPRSDQPDDNHLRYRSSSTHRSQLEHELQESDPDPPSP